MTTTNKALTAIALSIGVLSLLPLQAQDKKGASPGNVPALAALDYIEIQQLVSRYSYALDMGVANGEMYAGLFSPDGAFVQQNGESVSGRDKLAALARQNQLGPSAVFHFVMNHAIEPSQDGAIGRAYLAYFKIGENGQPSESKGGGHYDDVYVKTPDGWRFKRRQFTPSRWGQQAGAQPSSFRLPVPPSATPGHAAKPGLSPADYVEIQQLISRYAYGLDTGVGMGSMYAGVFAQDGVFVAGTLRLQGFDNIKAFAWQHRPGQGPWYVRNYSTNALIEPSAEGATGRIFAVVLDIADNNKSSVIVNGGHYEDAYVRTPDGWRIKKRQFVPSASGPPPTPLPLPAVTKATPPVPLVRPKDHKAMKLTVEDYVEIQQLAARYSHALDTGVGNGYAYADLFTPDADAFDRWFGREKIAEIPRWNPHGPDYVRHYGTNHIIEPTAEGAIGKQYVVVIDIGENDKASSIFLGGHYEDVYVKTNKGWRFKSRVEFPSASDPQARETA